MNPSNSAQDVLRCHLCETPVPPYSCEVCDVYLCKRCVDDHSLDESSEYKYVPIKQTLFALQYPKCLQHFSKKCELYCEQCTIPMCVQCVSSKRHRGHRIVDLLNYVKGKKEVSQNELKELESLILIQFQQYAIDIRRQKEYLNQNLDKLKTAIDEHGQEMHRQISAVVEKFKSEIVKKHEEKFAAMTKTEEKIAFTINDIEQCIVDAQELQASKDLGHVLEYTSRNDEFRFEPPEHNVTLATFVANEIEKGKLIKLFGSLSMASNAKSFEKDVKPKSWKAISCTTENKLTDKDKRKRIQKDHENAGGYRSEYEEEDEDPAFDLSRVSSSRRYEEAMMMIALRRNDNYENKAVVRPGRFQDRREPHLYRCPKCGEIEPSLTHRNYCDYI